ncbi:hypothetical protein GBAR_LOCUS12743 [Geodia barretti]|uniref:Uncharacterized protein n=2 Tax=Geodia barretti TaxID=519541 RepID=A0AA35S1C8_GEOBA|nr:hypothetical protein GBAR_LOCUS12743 [Geodia barretti]
MGVPVMWTIFAVALAKKTALYVVGRSYGFPRVYRRMVEFNRRTIGDRTSRRVIQERVKYFFRIPNKIGRGLGMRVRHGKESSVVRR